MFRQPLNRCWYNFSVFVILPILCSCHSFIDLGSRSKSVVTTQEVTEEPGNNAPKVFILSLEQLTAGEVKIDFILEDGDKDPHNVTVEFSLNNSDFSVATVVGNQKGLQTSETGVSHSLIWKSKSNLCVEDVLTTLRLTATDGIDSDTDESSVSLQNTPPTATLQPIAAFASPVVITLLVADQESDPLSITEAVIVNAQGVLLPANIEGVNFNINDFASAPTATSYTINLSNPPGNGSEPFSVSLTVAERDCPLQAKTEVEAIYQPPPPAGNTAPTVPSANAVCSGDNVVVTATVQDLDGDLMDLFLSYSDNTIVQLENPSAAQDLQSGDTVTLVLINPPTSDPCPSLFLAANDGHEFGPPTEVLGACCEDDSCNVDVFIKSLDPPDPCPESIELLYCVVGDDLDVTFGYELPGSNVCEDVTEVEGTDDHDNLSTTDCNNDPLGFGWDIMSDGFLQPGQTDYCVDLKITATENDDPTCTKTITQEFCFTCEEDDPPPTGGGDGPPVGGPGDPGDTDPSPGDNSGGSNPGGGGSTGGSGSGGVAG